jgi:diguanylate cyclase (GGDEF)-like protein
MYIFLSERMVQKDGLTQAWTRGSTESYLKRRVLIHPDKPIGILFYDVDNLKMINDTYGHVEGDQAIMHLVKVVRETFEGKAVLSRMGGDEFAVLLEVADIMELKRGVDAFRANIERLQPAKPYRTDASVGWGLYGLPDQTFDGFLRQVDKMMYVEKTKKQRKAKETEQ